MLAGQQQKIAAPPAVHLLTLYRFRDGRSPPKATGSLTYKMSEVALAVMEQVQSQLQLCVQTREKMNSVLVDISGILDDCTLL